VPEQDEPGIFIGRRQHWRKSFNHASSVSNVRRVFMFQIHIRPTSERFAGSMCRPVKSICAGDKADVFFGKSSPRHDEFHRRKKTRRDRRWLAEPATTRISSAVGFMESSAVVPTIKTLMLI